MIKYLTGDVTRPQSSNKIILPHICNDVGAWGAGFVVALSSMWKEPEESYRKSVLNMKLGDVDFVKVGDNITVANMIAQRGIKSPTNPKPIRYESLAKALQSVYKYANETGAEIHMPKIGSGLAGGDWTSIEKIINVIAKKYKTKTFVYNF